MDIQDLSEHIATSSLQHDRLRIQEALDIKPLKEFGTNYAEHYHSGESAIAKLINEAQAHKESGAKGEYKGQVAGAFHRDDIGDITLAWGEKGTGKSDGWGLSKIVEYHPEVLDKLDKLIQDLPIVKETENRYKLDNGDFFISIRKDFEGQKQNWVLTALERDESIARRRTDLPSSQSEAEKTTSANADDIIPQQTLKSTMQKFNYDEKKAKDLLEWHKDSSPLTKDENGVPKAENMLESSNKILGETMTLKDRLLIDNKIKYSYLKEIALDLPKPITKDDFLHLLKNKKYVNIQTPIKELEIEPLKAYEHLTQNSNKQNRIDISGAILPTLQNPLFITKDKKDTYYFYKPFKDEKGVLNIVSIAIPKSNRIRYKTSYIASRERMLKMINEYELVYEAF